MSPAQDPERLHAAQLLASHILSSLRDIRGLEIVSGFEEKFQSCTAVLDVLNTASDHLRSIGRTQEADAIDHVVHIALSSISYGGLQLDGTIITSQDLSELQFLVTAWLEALNSAERSKNTPSLMATKPNTRRAMTLAEKIFAFHDVESKGYVHPGETIRVSIDWIMASEASWSSMERTYEQLGKPGIFRNDRFWLAGDHVVHPKLLAHPTVARLINSSERARKDFRMTDYQGMNYTIMHTEFYRERAQPGMIVIGSDSHTCSSGAVGCLAIGLGAADVTMGLVTGEMWFKVPECVNIRLVGKPPPGIGGKDVILYILKQLKRNTVAADRVVEYTGPGVKYLSSDARFAVANMTTEFGGITGVFAPDAVTNAFIKTRKLSKHKKNSVYFKPDEDAVYAQTCVIDLSQTESCVARHPNPDDVVSVQEMANTSLDGCFIGACTTAEEDIILGALVLEQGLNSGLAPTAKGTRKVVPGSLPILDRLRTSGLCAIYEQAGFEIGVPGCSYCVGSIGNLASAATVAASSFEMKIRDPRGLIDQIPPARWEALKGRGSLSSTKLLEPRYVEPPCPKARQPPPTEVASWALLPVSDETLQNTDIRDQNAGQTATKRLISGKIQRLGDFIDTDALAPAQYLVECRSDKSLGAHCLEFTHPEFRQRVTDGFDIVVAGKAFGCGSSREQAVSALLGCGVKCVIAKSFAFIYSRNQPSLGLLGITLKDEEFYQLAHAGSKIDVDVSRNVVTVSDKEFPFQLSIMERELMDLGGITPAFMKFGKQIFDALCTAGTGVKTRANFEQDEGSECAGSAPLQW